MYRIIHVGGEEVGCTTEPNYIKVMPSGSYASCPVEEAQGLAYKGTPYNLFNHDEITQIVYHEEDESTEVVVAPQVLVIPEDAGDIINKQRQTIDTLILSGLEG